MGCSTKCCSIENECPVSEARSRRVGGASRSVPTSVGATDLIIDPCCIFLGVAGRVKEKGYAIPNRMENRADRWRQRRSRAAPPFARSTPAFVPHSDLDSPIPIRTRISLHS